MERASLSTLPFGVENAARETSRGADISNLIVESFNGGKTYNSWKGSSKPLTAPLIHVAANFDLQKEPR